MAANNKTATTRNIRSLYFPKKNKMEEYLAMRNRDTLNPDINAEQQRDDAKAFPADARPNFFLFISH